MQSNDSKGKKGRVSVYPENGRLKVRLPRQYFEDGQQPRYALNMEDNELNRARAKRIADRMQLDLEDGCFDESLEKYGINKKVKKLGNTNFVGIVTSSLPTSSLSTLDIVQKYCEYKESNLAETTYKVNYKGKFLANTINAVKSVGDDSVKIFNWLLTNRSKSNAKRTLSIIDSAYQLAIKQGLTTNNPFLDLHKDIELKKELKTYAQSSDIENDDTDILDKAKCYSWQESLVIRYYVKTTLNISHWYHIISFRFLTGCRPGEAYGLVWNDVKWEKECVYIRRSYASSIKKFKSTKNNTARPFPMPREGELWNLLKELKEGEPNEVVFKTKTGKMMHQQSVQDRWKGNKKGQKGIVTELIKQGKLKQFFPFYNCRHTFVTHQIFDLGREPEIVNAWCEHSDAVSRKHYRDVSSYAMQANPEVHASYNQNLSEVDILKKQLAEMQKQLDELKEKKSDS